MYITSLKVSFIQFWVLSFPLHPCLWPKQSTQSTISTLACEYCPTRSIPPVLLLNRSCQPLVPKPHSQDNEYKSIINAWEKNGNKSWGKKIPAQSPLLIFLLQVMQLKKYSLQLCSLGTMLLMNAFPPPDRKTLKNIPRLTHTERVAYALSPYCKINKNHK